MVREMEDEHFTVEPVRVLDGDVTALIRTAQAEGFGFMARLAEAWEAGTNRFDGPGEAYFAVRQGGRLVGAGGLNIDPYAGDAGIGRVRHVYVDPEARRGGVGRVLMAEIISAAQRNFSTLRLRTTTARGAAFYEALGFEPSAASDASHAMRL